MTAVGWTKSVLWCLLSAPLVWLGYLIILDLQAPTTALGADPGEAVVHYLGEWSLRMLLLSFSVTPIFKLTGLSVIAQARRLVGLWAFSYVVLHLVSYLFFYIQFDFHALLADFVERAYITAGLVATMLLTLMALTSTRKWRQRLGRKWQQLHMAIYPAIAAALIHLLWLTRDQFAEVVLYTAWFLVFVGLRYFYRAPARRVRTA